LVGKGRAFFVHQKKCFTCRLGEAKIARTTGPIRMSDPVPAVAEADATGAVAAMFADIRAVTGVGVVNLIWRHLATIPGGLEWAWGCVRPRYGDGGMADAADRLRAGLGVPDLGHLPLPDPAAGRILAAYDRTNARALLALYGLLARLDGVGAAPMTPGMPRVEEALKLPPLPALDSLAPETAALILRLNHMGAGRPDPILASMYRHLAYWPDFLAAIEAPLGRCAVRPMIEAALLAARDDGLAFAPLLADMPNLPAASVAAVRAALSRFAEDALARMVVICAAIRAATKK
jgi:hypothetical protein